MEAVLTSHEDRQTGDLVEYVPIDHYLLRHTRGIFWVIKDMLGDGLSYVMGEPSFSVFGCRIPNPLLFLFGWLYPPRISFLKFTATQTIRRWTFTRQTFQVD